MKLRVRAFDSAMFYRSEFCFISKCSRKCWGASEKCVIHFVLFMSVHDWCSSHLSRIFLKWNNIRIDKTQQNRTPWLVASFSAVQIPKIFTEARVMSTNVKSLEKIDATELYGNHLMDLSELLSKLRIITYFWHFRFLCANFPKLVFV